MLAAPNPQARATTSMHAGPLLPRRPLAALLAVGVAFTACLDPRPSRPLAASAAADLVSSPLFSIREEPSGRATTKRPAPEVRPAAPAYPADLFDLAVPGWRPAVAAAPRTDAPPPHRLVSVLHGNINRPEWDGATWQAAARPHGWVLCPRGIPRPDLDPRLDRWTYAGAQPIAHELEAGVAALEARFPGAVRRDDGWLVGFSLGAILASAVARRSALSFSALILVEGGADVSDWTAHTLATRGLRAVAYLCGDLTGCAGRARDAGKVWRRAGVPSRVFLMPRTGHRYGDDFDPLGREAVDFVRAATALPR